MTVPCYFSLLKEENILVDPTVNLEAGRSLLEPSLAYRVSSRTERGTQRDPI